MFVSRMLFATDGDCVQVINKPCVREAEYMCLISWTHHCGSEQLNMYVFEDFQREMSFPLPHTPMEIKQEDIRE
jgi:hypothetical protein